MFDRRKAVRTIFVGVGGWEVVIGRYDDLEVGGFVAGEMLVDSGESAKEQAGDVGESGGAASGDVAAGEVAKEMGEGMVDALGVWKSSALSASRSAKFLPAAGRRNDRVCVGQSRARN
jgi:hypothetical protein